MASSDHGIIPDLPPAIRDSPANPLSVGDKSSEDGGDYCRICRGEASQEQPLFYPCKCSGSIRFVHQECLMEWLIHSKKKYCELCKTPFRFTKLYDKAMPAILPLPLFLRQLLFHFFDTAMRWARYVLVSAIWFMCLPWCIRQVWRGLFWLADGSWFSEEDLRRSSLRQLNANLTQLNQNNATIPDQGIEQANSTFLDLLLNSTSLTGIPILAANESIVSMTLRFLSGETLVSKVLRILVSVPPLHFSSSPATNQTQFISERRVLRRPPSLLSDVKLLKSISTSPFLNHVTLDVLEGTFICLALVAGFILIFLIREWVINQQPMLNIPDPDLVENPPAPAAPAHEARPIIRPRRRRILPRAMNQAAQPEADANQQGPDIPPFPPPRRALTDDNIVAPATTGLERPLLPTRAQSLANAHPESEPDDGSLLLQPHTTSPPPSPPPLLRGAVGEAVNVHRALEEAPIASEGREVHPSRLFDDFDLKPSAEQLQNANEAPTSPLRRPSTPMVHFEPKVEVIEDVPNWPPILLDTDISHPSSASDPSPMPTPESSDGSPLDISVDSSAAEVLDAEEDQMALDAGGQSDNTLVDGSTADAAGDASDAEDLITDTDESDQSLPHMAALDRLAVWLWKVDGPVAAAPPHELHDNTHIVEAIEAGGPFVPAGIFVGQNVLPDQAAAANMAQVMPPPDALPHIHDWNDPNAADEIEDLEGVLELIGMEGPLVAMLQNVIFSLFLITVTLTASVWIPYIWGKITLLLIANPVIVLIKAPMFLISNLADLIADLVFFILGLMGLLFNVLTKSVKVVTATIFPPFSRLLDTELFEELAFKATRQSGNRLEKTLIATFSTLSPDLPAFSIQSHRALISFKTAFKDVVKFVPTTSVSFYESICWPDLSLAALRTLFLSLAGLLITLPRNSSDQWKTATETIKSAFNVQLKSLAVDAASPDNIDLVEWSAEDKIIAIIMGYLFFAALGYSFLHAAHFALGLNADEKVEGPVADGLRQAGGVLKVVVIIGIEMIIFPLYCGLLLDFALLPLFEGATIQTRLAFIMKAPFTGLFLHWFVGTCYMFHFALFVSICRRILRKGVLYFIRDPDDPTFHPVRDVLERPVPTQLGKIAFSALVYGGLVIMCLGGVVWGIGCIDGVLPIRWSTPEPRLAFPIDVIFFNFLLPVVLRKVEPSKKVSAIYEWWFRGCAHGLRLTQFLFGDEREDEKTTRMPWRRPELGSEKDGTYVRVPASDSCRIPKDKKVFLEVSESNERLDGQPDNEKGLHGKADDKWTKVYLPPQFKARVATFIVLLWLFAAGTGVACTIGPLLLGRSVVKWMAGSRGPVNDLYAFTVGIHLLGTSAYAVARVRPLSHWLRVKPSKLFSDFRQTIPHVWSATRYATGIAYLTTAFGLVFPFTLSLIAELYIHIPIFTFLMSESSTTEQHTRTPPAEPPSSRFPPTIFVLQTWTLGLLYLRLAFRIALNYPCPHTRLATAIRTVFRDGYLHPNIRLASRAIILPLTALCMLLLGAPPLYAKALITLMRVTDAGTMMWIYRMAYPGLMGLGVMAYGMVSVKRRMEVWRVKIRDEVYLVGERLHNYVDKKEKRRARATAGDKGKGKEKII